RIASGGQRVEGGDERARGYRFLGSSRPASLAQSAATSSATSATLSADAFPAAIVTAEAGSPNASARSLITARFAFPRSGAATTATLSAPPWTPAIAVVLAPALTRNRRRVPPGNGVSSRSSFT